MTTIKNVTEGEVKIKKLKSLIGFLSAKKINNYNRGGGAEGGIKKKKILKNLQNKSKNKNNKCFP